MQFVCYMQDFDNLRGFYEHLLLEVCCVSILCQAASSCNIQEGFCPAAEMPAAAPGCLEGSLVALYNLHCILLSIASSLLCPCGNQNIRPLNPSPGSPKLPNVTKLYSFSPLSKAKHPSSEPLHSIS